MFIKYKLSKIRKQLHMTQKELAKKSGVSSAMISFIENDRRHPTIIVLALIAKALCVKISDIVLVYDPVTKTNKY